MYNAPLSPRCCRDHASVQTDSLADTASVAWTGDASAAIALHCRPAAGRAPCSNKTACVEPAKCAQDTQSAPSPLLGQAPRGGATIRDALTTELTTELRAVLSV